MPFTDILNGIQSTFQIVIHSHLS